MVSLGAAPETLQHCGSQWFPISRPLRCRASSFRAWGLPIAVILRESWCIWALWFVKSTSSGKLKSLLKLPPFSCFAPCTSRVIARIRILDIFLKDYSSQPPFSLGSQSSLKQPVIRSCSF